MKSYFTCTLQVTCMSRQIGYLSTNHSLTISPQFQSSILEFSLASFEEMRVIFAIFFLSIKENKPARAQWTFLQIANIPYFIIYFID